MQIRSFLPSFDTVLVLETGQFFYGHGAGAHGEKMGELCFSTSMTGYQEALTDPSYAGQILVFTTPHIGNVGTNRYDNESSRGHVSGCVLNQPITSPSSHRAESSFADWLEARGLIASTGLDTRFLTHLIRKKGALRALLARTPAGEPAETFFDKAELLAKVRLWPGLEKQDLARSVGTQTPYVWKEALADHDRYGGPDNPGSPREWRGEPSLEPVVPPGFHLVVVDYGVKRQTLRLFVSLGCRVTVVPPESSFEDLRALKPDALLLSNGPGDPWATGRYAVPVLKQLLALPPEHFIPVLGICLGHQLLCLALGLETEKMKFGHRGINHPVQNLETKRVCISSQNHGFVVKEPQTWPDSVRLTERSLFDGTVEGIRLVHRPVRSVQFHPEAAPGPQESQSLLAAFLQEARRFRQAHPAAASL